MKGTKVKSNKGITLVALVITIIILLILAILAINAVSGDGIIGKAKEAGSSYNEKAGEENDELARQLGLIEGALGGRSENGGWKDNGDRSFTKEGVTVRIGDYVNYEEGIGYTYTPDISKGVGTKGLYDSDNNIDLDTIETSENKSEDLNWRVLGIDKNGRLEIISSTSTTLTTVAFYGIKGYLNGETVTNEMCNALYGNGHGACSARSMNCYDFCNLVNCEMPEPTYWKYGYADGCIRVKQAIDENDKDFSDMSTWNQFGKEFLNMITGEVGDPKTELYGLNEDGSIWKIDSEHSNITKVLKCNAQVSPLGLLANFNVMDELIACGCYDISTKLCECNEQYVSYGFSGDQTLPYYDWLFDGKGTEHASNGAAGVRPVVTLSSNVELTGNSTDGWNIQ